MQENRACQLMPRRARTPPPHKWPPHKCKKWSIWFLVFGGCILTIRPLVGLPKGSTCCSKCNREVCYVLLVELGLSVSRTPWTKSSKKIDIFWSDAHRTPHTYNRISTRFYLFSFLENPKHLLAINVVDNRATKSIATRL